MRRNALPAARICAAAGRGGTGSAARGFRPLRRETGIFPALFVSRPFRIRIALLCRGPRMQASTSTGWKWSWATTRKPPPIICSTTVSSWVQFPLRCTRSAHLREKHGGHPCASANLPVRQRIAIRRSVKPNLISPAPLSRTRGRGPACSAAASASRGWKQPHATPLSSSPMRKCTCRKGPQRWRTTTQPRHLLLGFPQGRRQGPCAGHPLLNMHR